MKVRFLKSVQGERYSYAEGHEVDVVDVGHGHGHIPRDFAEELIAAGKVEVSEADPAPAEEEPKKDGNDGQ